MKEVLIVMPSMKMGGAEKSLISMLNRLTRETQSELGISVELMIANVNGELYGEIPAYIKQVDAPEELRIYITQFKELLSSRSLTVNGLLRKIQWQIEKKICRNPEGLSVNELYWRKMSKYLSLFKKEYDVAISYMDGPATYYVVDKIKARKKFVWVHNQLEKLKVNKAFLGEFFSRVDGIVTISDLCADSIAKIYPEYAKKVYSIPNLSDELAIRVKSEAFFPEEFVGMNRPIVLSIGRLFYQKGFDIGIKAAKVLSDRGIYFVWFIMGTGELKNQLQQMVEEYHLEDKVILMGVRKNPYPYLKQCDVVFQPSRYEGKSVVLDEAKILLKPIVTAEYDTVHDQIKNDVTGIIARLDAEELADALQKVISSESIRHRLSDNLMNEMVNKVDEFREYRRVLRGEI